MKLSNFARTALLLCALQIREIGLPVDIPLTDENPLAIPTPGSCQLRVLTPTILELTLVTTKAADPAPVERWNFVKSEGQLQLPDIREFVVLCGNNNLPVQSIGFKRRVLYAPLYPRDLRIGNYLYLQLATPVAENQTVEVKNLSGKLWARETRFLTRADPLRFSPAIHVNQTGYLPKLPKKAMIGYYLGSLGEAKLDGLLPGQASPVAVSAPGPRQSATTFKLLAAGSSRVVFEGPLARRPDVGYTFPSYREVLEADFSAFQTPGEYRLQVPGLGCSLPFRIDEGVGAAFARTYALGLYHQRCGTDNVLPYTRYTHGPCHTALALVPLPETAFSNSWRIIASKTEDVPKLPKHKAPALKGPTTCLFPYVRQGQVDVSGGHHDAGDYSRYTINSAGLVHHLVFAADVFPGVAQLDNLGVPESGDGKGDLLQEAKWEADFLAKMQDDDGGFYFLVYPRNREYENDVTPDRGDTQIVWPKTTAVTAAAVAALAQCASSPQFKKQFPAAVGPWLEKARKGWDFLEKAMAKHGRDGAYQKITHYGNEFGHNDELAWAACEMFLATGEQKYHRELLARFNPTDPDTRRWSWWRMYECYGNAIRSYAFAAKTGRLKAEQLDLPFLTKCQNEVVAGGQDQFLRASSSAYGTSFPIETKRVRGAGWYFSEDAAFDLAVALQLDYPELNNPSAKYLDALLSNLNYIGGCNPVNISYLTGLGWKRPHCVVDQYAANDGRVMPPPGIPIGNVQAGFAWLDAYKRELGALSFPSDGAQTAPYPFYDRWGDSWNVSTEYVVLNQARGLGMAAFLMAQTPLKNQPWRFASTQIQSSPAPKNQPNARTLSLRSEVDLGRAQILWEMTNQPPVFGPSCKLSAPQPGSQHIEVEAVLPDGRYLFAITNLTVVP